MTGGTRTYRPALPAWVALPAVLAAAVVLLPLLGMVLRVPWRDFLGLVTAPASLDALRLSAVTALAAAALATVLGVPLALTLHRRDFPGRGLVRALVLLPLVMPPVVGGLALLYTFGRQGLAGRALGLLGVDIAFSTAAVVLAQVFVSLPFVVITVEAALRSLGTDLEAAAATLGAGPGRVLTRVTLPSLAPAVASGAVLAFARSLGEFGATITFAGSLQGVTRTLPLEVYLTRESSPEAAAALSVLLIGLALVIVLAVYRAPRRRRAEP